MTDPVTKNPPILAILNDAANLCTLAGVLSGMLGIYFAVMGSPAIAAMCGVIAVILDCFDGPIARRSRNRPSYMSQVGLQLDSLADAICSGVGPAVLLLAVGGWTPLMLVPASLIVLAGVTRLAYFNVFGLTGGSFTGLPIFYNPVVVALTLLALWLIAPGAVGIGAGIVGVLIAVLNVSPFSVPKLKGTLFYVFLVLCFLLCAVLIVGDVAGPTR